MAMSGDGMINLSGDEVALCRAPSPASCMLLADAIVPGLLSPGSVEIESKLPVSLTDPGVGSVAEGLSHSYE